MAKSFDELLDYLIEHIALRGEKGTNVDDFRELIKQFYASDAEADVNTSNSALRISDAAFPTVIDDLLVSKVWQWVTRDQDVRVEKRKREDNDRVKTVKVPGDAETSTAPGTATEAVSSADNHQHATKPKLPGPDTFLLAPTDRMWHALTGHGVDFQRIKPMEFNLLSYIAAAGEAGIAQTDLIKQSGQDKRSLPHRTDMLAEKGYITKSAFKVKGHNTSLCVLKKFAKPAVTPTENGKPLDALKLTPNEVMNYIWPPNEPVYLNRFFDVLMQFIREGEVMQLDQLRKLMGTQGNRRPTMHIFLYLRRLELLGLVQRIGGPSETSRNIVMYAFKLLKAPDETVRHSFITFKPLDYDRLQEQQEGIVREDDEFEDPEADDQEDLNNPETDDAQPERSTRWLTQWTPDRPLLNVVFDLVESAGPSGMSTMDFNNKGVGPFWTRPAASVLSHLTDVWQKSQPPHLRHLSIIRDTSMQERSLHYQYRTHGNFDRAVAAGETSWEAVQADKDIEVSRRQTNSVIPGNDSLDKWGFPVLPKSDFFKRGTATLAEARVGFRFPAQKYSFLSDYLLQRNSAHRKVFRESTHATEAGDAAGSPEEPPTPVKTVPPVKKKRGPYKKRKTLDAANTPKPESLEPGAAIEQIIAPTQVAAMEVAENAAPFGSTLVEAGNTYGENAVDDGQISNIMDQAPEELETPLETLKRTFREDAAPTATPRKYSKAKEPRSSGPSARQRRLDAEIEAFDTRMGAWARSLARAELGISDADLIDEAEVQEPDLVMPSSETTPTFDVERDVIMQQDELSASRPQRKPRMNYALLVDPRLAEQDAPANGASASISMLNGVSQDHDSDSQRAAKRAASTELEIVSAHKRQRLISPSTSGTAVRLKERTRAIKKELLAMSRPGLYISPPAARSFKQGRPRAALFVVVKSDRLHEKPWFDVTSEDVPVIMRHGMWPSRPSTPVATSTKPTKRARTTDRPSTSRPVKRQKRTDTLQASIPPLDHDSPTMNLAEEKTVVEPTIYEQLNRWTKVEPQVQPASDQEQGHPGSSLGKPDNFTVQAQPPMGEDAPKPFSTELEAQPPLQIELPTANTPFEPEELVAEEDGADVEEHVVAREDAFVTENVFDGATTAAAAQESGILDEHNDTNSRNLVGPEAVQGQSEGVAHSDQDQVELPPVTADETAAEEGAQPQQETVAAAESNSPTQDEDTHTPNVVIVDDEPSEQTTPKYIRSRPGRKVHPAKTGVRLGAGNIGHRRTQIIMQVVEKADGAYPGDREMFYAYLSTMSKDEDKRPDAATVKRALKSLTDSGRLTRITFAFKDPDGIVVKKHLVMLPGIKVDSPQIRTLQQRMVAAYPKPHFPEAVEIAPEYTVNFFRLPKLGAGGLDKLSAAADTQDDDVGRRYKFEPKTKPKPARVERVVEPAWKKWAKDENVQGITSALEQARPATPDSDDEAYAEELDQEQATLQSEFNIAGYHHNPSAVVDNKPRANARGSDWIRREKELQQRADSKRAEQEKRQRFLLKQTRRPNQTAQQVGLANVSAESQRTAGRPDPRLANVPPPSSWSESVDGPATRLRSMSSIQELLPGEGVLTAPLRRPKINPHAWQYPFGRRKPGRQPYLEHVTTLTDPDQQLLNTNGTYTTEFFVIRDNPQRPRLNIDVNSHRTWENKIPDSMQDLLEKNKNDGLVARSLTADQDAEMDFDYQVAQVQKWEELHAKDLTGRMSLVQPKFINYTIPSTVAAGTVWRNEPIRSTETLYLPPPTTYVPTRAPTELAAAPVRRTSSQTWLPLDPALPQTPSIFPTTGLHQPGYGSQYPIYPTAFTPPPSKGQTGGGVFGKLTLAKTKTPKTRKPKATPGKKRAGGRLKFVMKPPDIERLIAAVICVRTLLGGLDQVINWGLIDQLMPEHEPAVLRNHWRSIESTRFLQLSKLEVQFQEAYLNAEACRTIAPLDYNNIAGYDWDALVVWMIETLDISSKDELTELPVDRRILDDVFDIQEKDMDDFSKDEYFRDFATSLKRTSVLNELSFYSGMQPLVRKDSFDLQDRAKSTVRAITFTSEDIFDPDAARHKLERSFTEADLDTAIEALNKDGVLAQKSKGRVIPGRNFSIADKFNQNLKRNAFDVGLLYTAAQAKYYLDRVLLDPAGPGRAPVNSHAPDGEVMMLINLIAAKRLEIIVDTPPTTTDPNVKGIDPKTGERHLSIWGFTEGNYKTTQMDRDNLNFTLWVQPTASYVPGAPLPDPLPPPPPPAPQWAVDAHSKSTPIPVWYDIHDNLMPEVWEIVVVNVLSAATMRPGCSITDIRKMCRGVVEVWDLQLAVEWLLQVGVIGEVEEDQSAEGGRPEKWYVAKEWWWSVFGGGPGFVPQ